MNLSELLFRAISSQLIRDLGAVCSGGDSEAGGEGTCVARTWTLPFSLPGVQPSGRLPHRLVV